jgi:small-conductance mechanosensitive channel
VLVTGVAALMILRELRVDITPALTGAGIAGIAIGFGAQTIVRDVISGFFLILEDQCRVGDVAVVNGQGGLVEEINLRTIVLRDEDGTVHVFPNGEVKTLANKSKDFSYYVVTFGIGYDEDPERVTAAMRDAATALTEDPEFRPHILSPFEILGIDAFEQGRSSEGAHQDGAAETVAGWTRAAKTDGQGVRGARHRPAHREADCDVGKSNSQLPIPNPKTTPRRIRRPSRLRVLRALRGGLF